MVFCFMRYEGKMILRHRDYSSSMFDNFLPYYPCNRPSVMKVCILTEAENSYFQEVWKFCEENRMKQKFFVRSWGRNADGVVVRVNIDPKQHVLFKLRWA